MHRSDAQVLFVLALCGILSGCATEASVQGLRPEYPAVRHNFFNPEIAFVTVDSLQPILKWEPFPRPQDRVADKFMERVSTITYDLQIWRIGENGQPAELVYERNGLAVPYHKIETPLLSSREYLWSVRARFDLDGKPRVTEWGRPTMGNVGRQDVVPNLNFYRFETPAE